MSDPVICEVVVAAPVDAVWRALRDPAEIRRWFGWDYDEQGGLDEEIQVIFFQESTADDAARVLDTGGGVIALEAQGDRTVVRVTRAAPAGQAGWDGIYDEVNEGWLTFLQQLRFYLERHPGRDRSTLHVATAGDEWFRSTNQSGEVREDGSLVIRTPTRVIVSRYS
jgi:uncharacterized protein YndB with AHSA1/START domain